ncbi:MAG: UDP-N-acetylglucosamine 2-epimerase (non-hydrolyzing) [Verrucomicrobia bacterium]|nr:UDP-N-acetylglucosamine 2-epimerase (non-hydrolyzing) [Verrucomicrobiota bacterium]
MSATVAVLAGTRPEMIKLAPVVKALRREGVETVLVATAQHREMLDQVLEAFGLEPDLDLDLMRPDQTLFDLSSRLLPELERVYGEITPALVMLQGDTTTAFLSALAAYYLKIPVAHVEAGLRTGDKHNPFPEEVNRRLISVVADLHFAPTERAKANLVTEGAAEATIHVTGNTVVDALLDVAGRAHAFSDATLRGLDWDGRKVLLVTAHRRESFGEPLRRVFQALRTIAVGRDDVAIVYPVHPNPNVRGAAHELLGGVPRVHLTGPLSYPDFVHAMKRATLILSDSGGVQEEAPSLDTPVLVLRDQTERPEAIEAGATELVGTDPARITAAVERLLGDAAAYARMAGAPNPYGDGHAAGRIARAVRAFLGAPGRA